MVTFVGQHQAFPSEQYEECHDPGLWLELYASRTMFQLPKMFCIILVLQTDFKDPSSPTETCDMGCPVIPSRAALCFFDKFYLCGVLNLG